MSPLLLVFLCSFVGGGILLTALVLFGGLADGVADTALDSDLPGAASWLAGRSWGAALATGGFVGAAVLQMRAPAAVAVILAAAGAVAGVIGWRRVTGALARFDEDQSPNAFAALGQESMLTAAVDGADRPGIVQLTIGGLTHEYTAYADQALPAGTAVVVTALISPTVVSVAPLTLLSSHP